MSTDYDFSFERWSLLREWAHLLHSCLTSCIPLGVQLSMARSA